MKRMASEELFDFDATALASLLRAREVSPEEVLEASIERIERLNPAFNAVVTPMFDQARGELAAGLPDGPFRGVPFLVKDLVAEVKGVRFTDGTAFLSDFVPDQDSELVSRHRRAGLVILGKTNTPELGILPTTEGDLFGACHNPWDPTRTPGGSSGGSAVAVATRMVPMAHGNDGGGSLRAPASCCGLFGLKPSRARISMGGEYDSVTFWFAVEHGLTRSVRDSAALLDATCGPATGDPVQAPRPARPFAEEVGRAPGRLRIALQLHAPGDLPVAPDCVAAARDTAAWCESLGHVVEEAAPAYDGERLQHYFVALWSTLAGWFVDYWTRRTGRPPAPEHFEPHTWAMYQMTRETPAYDLLNAQRGMLQIARDVARFFERYDLWLTPTLAEPPVPLGSFAPAPDNPLAGLMRTATFSPFTAIANITGQPAMSVPLHWNGEGLPIGSQFIGPYGDEATLFRLAAQLEEAHPWAERRPPV